MKMNTIQLYAVYIHLFQWWGFWMIFSSNQSTKLPINSKIAGEKVKAKTMNHAITNFSAQLIDKLDFLANSRKRIRVVSTEINYSTQLCLSQHQTKS